MPSIDLGKVVGGVEMAASEATLSASNWDSSTQTVSVTGVTADKATCHVIVTPAPESHDDYTDAGIRCTGQGDGTLTFVAGTDPSADLVINVMILN